LIYKDIDSGTKVDIWRSERRCKNMKRFIRKFENMFVAATFAEAGEFDTARDILREKRPQNVDRISPTGRTGKELRAPGVGR
jgi:hypothetical protein